MISKKIFETYAENAFDISEKENILRWKREYCNANYKKFFPEDKSAKLLDIGPGLGEMMLVEKEWGYTDVYAIDISPSVIGFCKENGLECEQVDDTADWLKKHPDCYDVITLLDVFEHVPQDSTIEFLEACKQALRDKGVLILQVPNIQSPDSFLHRYNDITHVFGYSQHTLQQLFSVVGFQTVKFYPFEEYPGTDKDIKITRRLRSIYWKMVSANREITHNLQPDILTPEIFAVLSKHKVDLPDHNLEDEFDNDKITLSDIKNYFDKIGSKVELVEVVENILSEVECVKENQEKLDDKLAQRASEIQDNMDSKLDQRASEIQDNIEQKNIEWKGLLDEQNGRLVTFIDEKEHRLDEHNEWTRNRLDALENQVEALKTENQCLEDKIQSQERKLQELRTLLPKRIQKKLSENWSEF